MENKKQNFRGRYIHGELREPWKDFNPNCMNCRYRTDSRSWASVGTCNYAYIVGRIRGGKAKDCKGYPGKRIVKRSNNPYNDMP